MPSRPPSPRVSVALCTHNGAAYIADQVRSILAQRPSPFELVVGDDASTDDTVTVLEGTVADVRAADPTCATELIVRRHDPALGVVRNFADTLNACRGELVALSDQDDVWRPGKVAALVERFEREPALLLAHTDARLVDGAGMPLGHTLLEALEATESERAGLREGDAFAVLVRRNLVTGATVMLRRRLLEAAAPFPDGWVHDEWLGAIAAALGELRLLDETWIDYRQHDANQIGARRPTMAHRWRKLREPRAERAAWLVERAGGLVDRLEAVAAPEARIQEARAKLAHELARSRLPAFPPWRVPGILSGVVSGRYRRYSRGAIDVLRDLVTPDPRSRRTTMESHRGGGGQS